jgi:hypothetical protein
MTPPAAPERYKHHRFPAEIIGHGVWLYYRFCLSYRDVEELLFVRGVLVSHEAIRQWCRKFGQAYANQLRRPRPGDKWHLDEVFLRLRNAALSSEMGRQLEGTVEADDLYHTAGQKGQAKQGGKQALGRRPRGWRKKREPGRGHDDKDRPAIIAWVSRQGTVVVQGAQDFTVKTVQKAADLAVKTGTRLSTDSAGSYCALKGYVHDFVNHTKKEYARGDVHENRAECLFFLLKPYLRVFRSLSKTNLPGLVPGFHVLVGSEERMSSFPSLNFS